MHADYTIKYMPAGKGMSAAMRKYAGPYETELRPNADMVMAQMMHWFGDQMTGQIDIGYVCISDGKLNKFRRFELDQIEELVDHVVEVNRVPGQSIYFRPALVRPDAPRNVTDGDFLRSTGIWIDLDDAGAAEQAPTIYSTTRPTMVVVTGRHPHLRVQLFYRSAEEIDQPGHLRDLNRRAAALLHGDTLVINPTSLMRIGGTIAWPWKTGREIEMTELRLFPERQQRFPLHALERAFPPVSTIEQPAATETDPASIGDLLSLSPRKLMARIRAGEHWHNNMLRLVGHWISRGWQDEEILTTAEAMTLPGYTAQQTRHEVAQMIRTGRQKWNMPEPDVTAQANDEQPPLRATPLGVIDPKKIPPRQWILGRRLIRKFVTLTVAPGGAGKSMITMEEAIAIATGIPITGAPVAIKGPTWIYNNEDPLDELQRRITAICIHHNIPRDGAVATDLHLDSGRDRRLLVAKTLNKAVVQTPDADALMEEIQRRGILAMTIDPFVRVHQVEENDNAAIDMVADIFAYIADRTGCAFNLVHHTRKMPASAADGEITADSTRGAGSLVAAARIANTVVAMTRKDAERLGIEEEQRHWYVRMDDAKGNMSAPAENATWFRWVSVPLNNGTDMQEGDEIGVLEPWQPPDTSGSISMDVAMGVLREIQTRWNAGDPYSKKGDRSVLTMMRVRFQIPERQGKKLLADWLNNGVLVYDLADRKTKMSGFQVAEWPGEVT